MFDLKNVKMLDSCLYRSALEADVDESLAQRGEVVDNGADRRCAVEARRSDEVYRRLVRSVGGSGHVDRLPLFFVRARSALVG